MDQRVFRATFDFQANDPAVELSIHVDDILIEVQTADYQQSDQWTLVCRLQDPAKSGFVPSNRVEQLSSSEAQQYLEQYRRSLPSGPNPVHSSTIAPPPESHDAVPASFSEMFARHDAYFKSVVAKREQSFSKLEEALESAAKEIGDCKERNARLRGQISELDQLIEEERRKWRERLEQEKKSLFQSLDSK
eukprot:gnl/Dysnectes_brevis/2577_a3106_1959.p1 GENE.gnl/Dysnectes_brevis/2577_a3106_1959~~gnl/Dysnectes_brevis/2577_a3106_1959.p1  ORF type:complete len:191 (+),score=13.66 gnl/Dysnectes_brevis/2577_a3106_1959:95-667(+)